MEFGKCNNSDGVFSSSSQQPSIWTEIVNGPNGEKALETTRCAIIGITVAICIGLALGYAPTLSIGNASFTFGRANTQ